MHYQLFAAGKPVKVYQSPCRPYDIKTYSGEIYKHIADEMAFAIKTGVGPMEFTVVPEPTSGLLVLFGSALLALRRRKQGAV